MCFESFALRTVELRFPRFIVSIQRSRVDSSTAKMHQTVEVDVYVVVNFLFQLIFIFPLFWGMVMYANEYKTKEKQKLTEIKN